MFIYIYIYVYIYVYVARNIKQRGSKLEASAPHAPSAAEGAPVLISHKVFWKSFCKRQFPHKSVNLFFILAIVKGIDFCETTLETLCVR